MQRDIESELDLLIYNYPVVYTGRQAATGMPAQQRLGAGSAATRAADGIHRNAAEGVLEGGFLQVYVFDDTRPTTDYR